MVGVVEVAERTGSGKRPDDISGAEGTAVGGYSGGSGVSDAEVVGGGADPLLPPLACTAPLPLPLPLGGAVG